MEAMDTLHAVGITTLELDVTVPESVASVREEVIKLCDGKLDILVNNAYVLLLLLPPAWANSSVEGKVRLS